MIRKHLDGDLELLPGLDRHVELRSRVKPNSLLVTQEAVGAFSPSFGCGGPLATACEPALDFRWEVTV